MGLLSSADRNALSSSTFGLPGSRKYPMPDVSHAVNAKARASQQLHRGGLSQSQYNTIVAKANAMIRAHKARA